MQGQLKQQIREYLSDSKGIVDRCITAARSTPEFSGVFRAALATESVLAGLSAPNLKPTLNPARSIVLRLPMLAAIGQGSIARAELRRFLELILWTVYFTDHPREWLEFQRQPSAAFARDPRRPITYAAHRELGFYLEYAQELMESEPSGLGRRSADALSQRIHQLNAVVHAGHLARAKRKAAPFESPDAGSMTNLSGIQKAVFAHSCVVLAAYKRARFENLSAGSRSSFDWLVGTTIRREIRSGQFGIC
ncbi:MAG: hypothetical protein ACLQKY_03450 [Terracidiphilus sp.]